MIDVINTCRQCLKKEVYKVLKSNNNGKTIRLCEKCFNKKSKGLINGHGYVIIKQQ